MLKKVSFVVLTAAMFAVYESTQGQPNIVVMTVTKEATANIEDVEVVAVESNEVQTAVTDELPCIISKFDPIMRKVGEEEGQDWRLMSAIAYHESRFIENLQSKHGARGIMQIRPVVARHFDVPVESIEDTETNIRLAGMLLTELDDMLHMPASTPVADRMSIILASYNAGIGHVLDARRLARMEGANPNSWDEVSHYLQLKADPAYYELDEVQSGKFTGSRQTLAYVREVMEKYDQYCTMAS